jgi:hypothetical protein
VCAAVVPVSHVLGTHLHGLLSQLTTVWVLETTQHKYNTGLEGGRKEWRRKTERWERREGGRWKTERWERSRNG